MTLTLDKENNTKRPSLNINTKAPGNWRFIDSPNQSRETTLKLRFHIQ
jgi:hypothetical protein